MDNSRSFLPILLLSLTLRAAFAQQQTNPGEPTVHEILDLSGADQLAYLDRELNEGLPYHPSNPVMTLIVGQSALVLPVIERKIEEVLHSSKPQECFTDKSVDPRKFVDSAASYITQAGNEYALQALSKLVALDEQRFGILVRNTMYHAQNQRNPFIVAYRGLDIGNPAVDKRILAWVEEEFDNKTEFWHGRLTQWWAEAMVEKYRGRPTETDWHFDPIASRIKRHVADSVHDDVIKLAAQAAASRDKE